MPNQRAPGQKLLTLPCKKEFIQALDDNLERCKYSNRSQFIRDAIVEKLEECDVKIPHGLALSPPRPTGTGQTASKGTDPEPTPAGEPAEKHVLRERKTSIRYREAKGGIKGAQEKQPEKEDFKKALENYIRKGRQPNRREGFAD